MLSPAAPHTSMTSKGSLAAGESMAHTKDMTFVRTHSGRETASGAVAKLEIACDNPDATFCFPSRGVR
jgi:hypothetical protein